MTRVAPRAAVGPGLCKGDMFLCQKMSTAQPSQQEESCGIERHEASILSGSSRPHVPLALPVRSTKWHAETNKRSEEQPMFHVRTHWTEQSPMRFATQGELVKLRPGRDAYRSQDFRELIRSPNRTSKPLASCLPQWQGTSGGRGAEAWDEEEGFK